MEQSGIEKGLVDGGNGERTYKSIRAKLQEGLFGCLYTLKDEKIGGIELVLFVVFVDFWQALYQFVFGGTGFPWSPTASAAAFLSNMAAFLQFQYYFLGGTVPTYGSFLVVLAGFIVLLLMVVALLLYVARAFVTGQIGAVWTIVFLRSVVG